jgi:hypothetical protein
MRRRRQLLQVQTFPFLAVLLCTMGSLILLLLVIDRRAKAVARAKALASVEKAAEAEAKKAADREAEWQRKRRELRALLASQEEEVESQIRAVAKQSAAAAGKLQAEAAHSAELRRRLQAEEAKLHLDRQEVLARRAAVGKAEEMTEATRKEAARQAEELAQLEQVLAGLKALHKHPPETYSIVPYLGRNGENRRPIYAACAGQGVIFHPDHLTLSGADLVPLTIRQELDRRLAEQQGSGPKTTPYLLLLVRPDGLATYNLMQRALAGLRVDFGYELIDQDWTLDLSDGAQMAGGLPRPLNATPRGVVPPPPLSAVGGLGWHPGRGSGSGPVASVSVPPPGSILRGNGGGSAGAPGPGSVPGVGFNPAGPAGGSTWPAAGPTGAGGGPWPGFAPRAGGAAAATFAGSGTPAGSGSAAGAAGVVNLLPPLAGAGAPGQGPGFAPGPAPAGGGAGPYRGGGGPGYAGGGAGLGAPSPVAGGPAGGVAGARPGVGFGAEEAPEGSGIGPASSAGQGGAGTPGGGNGGTGASWAPVGVASGAGATSAPGSPGGPSLLPSLSFGNPGQPTAAAPGAPGAPGAAAGSAGPGGSPGDGAEGPGVPAFMAGPLLPRVRAAARPSAIPLGRLIGNRDWSIIIDCREHEVLLLATAQRFPLASLRQPTAGPHALSESVRRLIDRRQATVRPGEPPYRPVLRFRVYPDGLRSYYAANSLLDALGLPATRENLDGPEPALPESFRP